MAKGDQPPACHVGDRTDGRGRDVASDKLHPMALPSTNDGVWEPLDGMERRAPPACRATSPRGPISRSSISTTGLSTPPIKTGVATGRGPPLSALCALESASKPSRWACWRRSLKALGALLPKRERVRRDARYGYREADWRRSPG